MPGSVLSCRYAGVHVSVAGSWESSTAHDQGTSCSVTCSETQAEGSCAYTRLLSAHVNGTVHVEHAIPEAMNGLASMTTTWEDNCEQKG